MVCRYSARAAAAARRPSSQRRLLLLCRLPQLLLQRDVLSQEGDRAPLGRHQALAQQVRLLLCLSQEAQRDGVVGYRNTGKTAGRMAQAKAGRMMPGAARDWRIRMRGSVHNASQCTLGSSAAPTYQRVGGAAVQLSQGGEQGAGTLQG